MFGVTCLFINYSLKAIINGLENQSACHTQKVYVTTAADMPEQAV